MAHDKHEPGHQEERLSSERPSWDTYFLQIAHLTSQRSNCCRRKVGTLLVKDNRILSLGYNGTPRGHPNCFEGGCPRCASTGPSGHDLDLCLCIHAEENALLFVSKDLLEGSTLYTTLFPCMGCTKKILQCRIARIVYSDIYNMELFEKCRELYAMHSVKIEKHSD